MLQANCKPNKKKNGEKMWSLEVQNPHKLGPTTNNHFDNTHTRFVFVYQIPIEWTKHKKKTTFYKVNWLWTSCCPFPKGEKSKRREKEANSYGWIDAQLNSFNEKRNLEAWRLNQIYSNHESSANQLLFLMCVCVFAMCFQRTDLSLLARQLIVHLIYTVIRT